MSTSLASVFTSATLSLDLEHQEEDEVENGDKKGE